MHARMLPLPIDISISEDITKGLKRRFQPIKPHFQIRSSNLRDWDSLKGKGQRDHSDPAAGVNEENVVNGSRVPEIAVRQDCAEYRAELAEEIEDVEERGRRLFGKVQRVSEIKR